MGSSPSGSKRISSQRTASWPSASTRAARSSRGTTTLIRELEPERVRVDTGAALDPRAVLGRDERRQRRAVVMRGHRRKTASFDGCNDGTFRLDATARLRVVGTRDELLLAGTHLERERALRRLRE